MKIVIRLNFLSCLIFILMSGYFEIEAQVSNGRIAFVRAGEIYSANSNGSGIINLTNNPANDYSPAYSFDGSKIVFASNRDGNSEIYIMNQNGSNPTRLTTSAAYNSDPAFSPNGTKIVFTSYRDGNYEIYTMNSDGTNVLRLTNNTESDTQPKFSPDGSKIVFTRSFSGSPNVIFRMNADGTDVLQISFGINDTSPSYSPDGTRVIFRRMNNATFNTSFVTVNPDGSGEGVVFAPSSNFPVLFQPSYSPDGNQIIYYEQYQINPTGYRVRFVGSGTSIFDATNPVWQPIRPAAPRKTLFDFDGDGKTDIGIFRPSTGEWWINRSSNNQTFALQFGRLQTKLVPADFTGDGKTDIAFWRSGQWFILRSEDISFYAFPFGTTGDIPAPGDFDGDGKADAAVFRPSNATWYIQRSSDSGNYDSAIRNLRGSSGRCRLRRRQQSRHCHFSSVVFAVVDSQKQRRQFLQAIRHERR